MEAVSPIKPKHVMLTKELPPEAEDAFMQLLSQLPIVWAKREGGTLRIPITEADATEGYVLDFEMQGTDFVFSLKQMKRGKA